ncbi:hypothetical protein Vretifemale_351, partial [Volvox reticuliferus]
PTFAFGNPSPSGRPGLDLLTPPAAAGMAGPSVGVGASRCDPQPSGCMCDSPNVKFDGVPFPDSGPRPPGIAAPPRICMAVRHIALQSDAANDVGVAKASSGVAYTLVDVEGDHAADGVLG